MTPKHPWRSTIRDTVIPIAWLIAACIIIGGAAAGAVRAEPLTAADDYAINHAVDICLAVDANPSVSGLLQVLIGVTRTGLTEQAAGAAVGESVFYVCPQYRGLLRAFVARYGGATL